SAARARRLHPRPRPCAPARRHRAAPPEGLPRTVLQQHRIDARRQLSGHPAHLVGSRAGALDWARTRLLPGTSLAHPAVPGAGARIPALPRAPGRGRPRRPAVAGRTGPLRVGRTRPADQRIPRRRRPLRSRWRSARRRAAGVTAGVAARLCLAGAPHRARIPARPPARRRDLPAPAARCAGQGGLPATESAGVPAAATARPAAEPGWPEPAARTRRRGRRGAGPDVPRRRRTDAAAVPPGGGDPRHPHGPGQRPERVAGPARGSARLSAMSSPPPTPPAGSPPAAAAVSPLATRFRGYLPVVVDVETGGFDWNRHALLEIAVLPLELDDDGLLVPGKTTNAHVVPAPGMDIDPKSLEITGIRLDHPFRLAKEERPALDHVFAPVREACKRHGCQRAILVGHNAH